MRRGTSCLVILIAVITLGTAFAQSAHPSAIDRDLMEVDITGLQRLYAQHRYTIVQVTQWYLDRIARYDGTYNALLYVDAKAALRRAAEEDAASPRTAHGTLWGVPIVIKANTSVQGWVTSAGWEGYTIPGKQLVSPRDALVVARLRGAGAILLGQTNMPDFAASDTNVSTAGGRTGDAYDVRFSPGGSSGGTATAVAANFAVFGTGTDTANSIRQPAANNSLVGILPTRGLTSIAGIHPLDWLRDNTGPLARNVTTAATALEVMRVKTRSIHGRKAAQPRPNPFPTPPISKKTPSKASASGSPGSFSKDPPPSTAPVLTRHRSTAPSSRDPRRLHESDRTTPRRRSDRHHRQTNFARKLFHHRTKDGYPPLSRGRG